MAVTPGQPDVLQDLRERSYREGGVFWLGDDQLAVFEPAAAQAINAQNFADLTLPDSLSDLLRGREGKKIYWQQIRERWLAQMRPLSEPAELEKLAERMSALLDERADAPHDLVWVAQEVFSRALLPVVIGGLGKRDTALVIRDQDLKLRHNVLAGSSPGFWQKAGGILVQIRAGQAVRREVAGRAKGRRPRQLDLADPFVDFLPELGMGRTVDTITGVLAAIAGPPGGAAACMVYALLKYPQWQGRVREELAAVSLTELCAAPTRLAPLTHCFLREILRLWSPTPLAGRQVRTQVEHAGVCLRPGQEYLLSPDILHHDPRLWKNPNTFDPDRWLPGAERAPQSAACYAPFGWAPRACIGAGLGTAQLILLCHLLCTRFRIEGVDAEKLAIALPSMPVPQNMHGILRRQS